MRQLIKILVAGTIAAGAPAYAAEIVRILRASFDSIFLEGADVSQTLKTANNEVNALFK